VIDQNLNINVLSDSPNDDTLPPYLPSEVLDMDLGKYGTIRRDSNTNGQWFLDLYWQGERHRLYRLPLRGGELVACKSQEAAEILQYIVSRQIDQGIFRPERFKVKKPLHLSAYADEWLSQQTQLMASTLRDYKSHIKNYIKPRLGDIFIDDLSAGTLESFMRTLPVSAKTKKNIMGTLMKILRDAKRAGDLFSVPDKPRAVGKDKVIDPEVHWIEPETQSKILDCIRDIHRPIYMFMMLSGVRPSEARALRWQDVHMDKQEIIIAKTLDYKGALVPVKGKKILPLPMTKALCALFQNIEKTLSPHVFPNPLTGRLYRRDAMDKIWRKACKKALGGQVIPLYQSTRHSFASQLVNAGIDIAAVQRLLRHTDARTTRRYYEFKTAPLRITLDNVRSIFDVRGKSSVVGSKPSVNRKEKKKG